MVKFELVSPERMLASTEVESVTIPGQLGDLTALENHAPFLTTLRPGYVETRGGSDAARYFVTGGFAEISDNTVSILAEETLGADEVTAEWLAGKIADAEQALADASGARAQMAGQKLNDFRFIAEHLG